MMSPSLILTYIKVFLWALSMSLSAYIMHQMDNSSHQKQIIQIQKQAIEHEEKVVADQAAIAQQKVKEKENVQNRYDALIASYRGMRQSVGQDGNTQAAPAPIPSQGLRLLEQDAEFLVGFAKQCSITELERNEVIEKYNTLESEK
jgi:hypothetical protein